MKHSNKLVTALWMLATGGSLPAATVRVDWLVMQGGGTSSSFNLLDDNSIALAHGSLTIINGLAYPGLPATRTFAAANWSTQPNVADTLTGNSTISAFELRVAPMTGSANYLLDILVPENRALVLAIGGLLKSGGSATQAMELAAVSDSGMAAVTLRTTDAWSNTLTNLSQDVVWDPLTQVLSPAATANGDSAFAFFDVAPLIGANGRLRLSVPAGYATGTGDSIFIGLGTVVPEPSSLWLALSGVLLLLRRRR